MACNKYKKLIVDRIILLVPGVQSLENTNNGLPDKFVELANVLGKKVIKFVLLDKNQIEKQQE